jgi:histidinol-phosphate/aromatic aminotransferase/cobyric acid decarboxylase-like protein
MKSVILSPVPEVLESIKNFKKTNEGELLQQETYTYWQDYYGEELIKMSRKFLHYVSKDINDFTNGYVFSGSNEAHYKLLMLIKREGANLHIMESEYEGYRYVAKDYGINVIFHNRDTIEKTLKEIKAGDNFWLSNPNSMDGCLLENYDKLMKICEECKAKVYIDMVYVGTVARPYTINLNYNCIYAVSWSGSKTFPGLFYYRIGVLFTKDKYEEFLGTRWFHNMESIRIGLDILTRYDPFDIPKKYMKYQEKARKEISKILDYPLEKSDCIWLLHTHKPLNKRKDLDYFYRPNSETLRLTISEYIIRNATNYLQNSYKEFIDYNVDEIIKSM